ncbi:MAG: TonB-dependent receptor [Thermonemataceae bacterium]|nr:TonB-dependent receptor [Thermonemataceae bacterium]
MIFYSLKNKTLWIGLYCLLFWDYYGNAQTLQGIVQTSDKKPITAANIFWLGTNVGSQSDSLGRFEVPIISLPKKLIIQVVDYQSDTILVQSKNFLKVTLVENKAEITAVEVTANSSFVDKESVALNEFISSKELSKAACCNLSESFETNASIDVASQDAITGTKKIKMLGLDGVYVLINAENLPFLRGLAISYGLNFIPGTWVQSIDIIKGAGSVLNGYESMTGQINVEILKPDAQEKAILNTYLNYFGRAEINAIYRTRVNKRWHTNFLTHLSTLQNKMDTNQDSFLDTPLYTQYNFMNRWKRKGEKMMSQFGWKYLYDQRKSGQIKFWEENPTSQTFYGTEMRTHRAELFAKNALIFPKKPQKSIGLINSLIIHQQNGFLGKNTYEGNQQTSYNQFIYQNILKNTNHQYRVGGSIVADTYQEKFADSTFSRREFVAGIFAEYTWKTPKITFILGNRLDWHNLFAWVYTPRLNIKYSPKENTILRISAGRGFRVANSIAENIGLLVNNRQIISEGLTEESSWIYGLSLQQEFSIFSKKASLVTDFFHTRFEKQLIVDMDSHQNKIYFKKLNGLSYANSFQIELQYNLLAGLETKFAYKFYDVQMPLANKLQEKPFVSRNRWFANFSYTTRRSAWQFDATLKWNGRQRLPQHTELSTYSPTFLLLNAQISKTFWKKFEIYVGGENLSDFRQEPLIISPDNTENPNFDASMVWGTSMGRLLYLGTRLKIK